MSGSLLLHVATAFFVANTALGLGVGLRLVSTRGFGWVHHALFFVVVVTALAAVVAGVAAGAAYVWGLVAALAVFTVLPRLPGGTRRHTVAALVAGCCYAVAYVAYLAHARTW